MDERPRPALAERQRRILRKVACGEADQLARHRPGPGQRADVRGDDATAVGQVEIAIQDFTTGSWSRGTGTGPVLPGPSSTTAPSTGCAPPGPR